MLTTLVCCVCVHVCRDVVWTLVACEPLSHAVLIVYTSAMAMAELQMFAVDDMFRVSPYSSRTNRIFVG